MKRNSSPSSPRSAPAPDLALHPSRCWRGLTLGTHAAALPALAILPWPLAVRLLLATLLMLSLLRALRAQPWTRLVAAGGGRWWLFDALGTPHAAHAGGVGLRHPWLVTLPLRLDDGRRRVVAVWSDAVSAEDHAALRRWLVVDATPPAR